MCMGCMSHADFLVTGGMVGAAGARVGARMLLTTPPGWLRKVSDAEATAFVESLGPARELASDDLHAADREMPASTTTPGR